MEYYKQYAPENFSIHKILDKKYRCIRFFHDKDDSPYMQKICQLYYYDYIAFSLEKSRYIFMYYAHNVIVISLIAIFHLAF
jgi:hypothetical protein